MHRKPDRPHRVVIENIRPQVDGGAHLITRTPGEAVDITADIFADGHDVVRANFRWREVDGLGQAVTPWVSAPMLDEVNDLWLGSFVVERVGWYEYAIDAWVDRFRTWRRDLQKKAEAGQDVSSELLEGAALVRTAAARAPAAAPPTPRGGRRRKNTAGATTTVANERRTKAATLAGDETHEASWMLSLADRLATDGDQAERVAAALSPLLLERMDRHSVPSAVTSSRTLGVMVEPERARFGAWYEMFPRSYSPDPTRSATLDEAAERLPAIAALGFDVLYLPPIHPIGHTFRKGPNNSLIAGPTDPGSPWAIGDESGGHTSVHPDLGTIDDFDRFVARARELGIDIALDVAYQCSPDHPYVREHPEWFRHRPDGSIKYAENPPKKYQDIYPFDFECEAWPDLWEELKRVVLFWVEHGVTIFRVDNPHTKPFAFWAWMMAEVRRERPGVIFLAEAFTRPKIVKYLAKIGFSQSYTYFTWRNSKAELTEYFTELTQTEVREYMRPNLFANTPDILHEYLQQGGRPAFEARLVLAATLGASYGIYSGFEICENRPVRPGSEEYLDSEKYQYKQWDWDRPGNILPLIARVNAARKANPALQSDWSLRFHETDNRQIIAYSKSTPDLANVILVVVNLDPVHLQHGFVQVPASWDLEPDGYWVEDLLSGERYHWRGTWNYIRLDPGFRQAHVLRVETEAMKLAASRAIAAQAIRDAAPQLPAELEDLTT